MTIRASAAAFQPDSTALRPFSRSNSRTYSLCACMLLACCWHRFCLGHLNTCHWPLSTVIQTSTYSAVCRQCACCPCPCTPSNHLLEDLPSFFSQNARAARQPLEIWRPGYKNKKWSAAPKRKVDETWPGAVRCSDRSMPRP